MTVTTGSASTHGPAGPGTGTRNLAVDPWPSTAALGFASGMLVPTPTRTLYLAGQAAVDARGAVVAPGAMAGQVAMPDLLIEVVCTAAR